MKTPVGFIVTYNPSPNFFVNLDSFYTQLDQLLIVDNGSNPDVCHLLTQEAQNRGTLLKIIYNETNHGIATALNQGCCWALEQGYSHLIAFDQDSYPAPGMVSNMLEAFSAYNGNGRLAVIAPVVMDPIVDIQARYLRPKNILLYERVSCEGNVLENVTYVITSGSLFDLTVYQEIGPFRDDFFIDYVDMEYCLRARENGYRVVVACKAFLNHRQGDRQKRVFLGSEHFPTFHSPQRWYFIGRNRIPMLRRYALRFPHWLLYELVASFYVLVKMLLFETQRGPKLHALLLGTLDGIRGRMGKGVDINLDTND
jgi:rhamnosyltransferase